MVETRRAPRYRVSKPAQIQYGAKKTACVVRDLSVTGAALQLSDGSATVPVAFTLLVPEDNLTLPCRVVWRAPFKIGVTFDLS
ncbi:PilZ domain-containing protein [Bradyrhizobium manausense]|uniref:PilZ domain-containing protein n=1 Tax=Bradyrhizobium manausense TaxID=989370 RepID=UPI001BA8024D|nr:PilZ domain-containing protein [Bradyrhizobium manausense]MBR1086448.1 PilZ domain-containing protein [Bradyrhizobium manausense]